jgi:hypothetical protein
MSNNTASSARLEALTDLDARVENVENHDLSAAESQNVKGGLNPQPLPPRWMLPNPGYPLAPISVVGPISQY